MRTLRLDDDGKCFFPLGEEQKTRKTFFSHTSGSLGASAWGVLGHIVWHALNFLCCRSPLRDPTHLHSHVFDFMLSYLQGL